MKIVKRDGREVEFDSGKIFDALEKCFNALGKPAGSGYLSALTDNVVRRVTQEWATPTVENVQDVVERVLIYAGEIEAARAYILYREERAKVRIPADVREAFAESAAYFGTPIQEFQFYSKYSRYSYEEGRRETWVEAVERAVDFLKELSHNSLQIDFDEIKAAMLKMEAMPSMRLMAMAGEAARRNNITIYNCAYVPVDSVDAFGEALYISMSGCGVGYSVEKKFVDSLPPVEQEMSGVFFRHTIEDSAEGWVLALRKGLITWISGAEIEFDYSLIRPAGAVLKTKGGRASGPEPFRSALNFIRKTIQNRRGRKLRPIDAHDIMCAVGNAAVSGGMRRTAMLSLFDFDDEEMRHCKDGDLANNQQRWNANNSIVLATDNQVEFMELFLDMVRSGRGEPGIFNRRAAQLSAPKTRDLLGNDIGCNPCGEVILKPMEFCNLSIAIARPDDDVLSLINKVRIATIIGTIQSTATKFPLLRDEWRKNCEDERLLGVDITGHMDCPALQDEKVLSMLRKVVRIENERTAAMLGINPAAAATCVKPSGNSSVLFDCSPGVHARWSPYYIRNVRISATSPVYKVLKDAGVPMSPEVGQTEDNAITWVVSFPVKSPRKAKVRGDVSARDQFLYWLMVKRSWAEHSVSCTITYREDELIDLLSHMWIHKNELVGLTVFPLSDARYELMPYVEISEQEYEKRAREFPKIDFSRLWLYEKEDYTTASQELACHAGGCDL